MNVCFFGGRLVRDFEERECADGSKVLTNALAIKKSKDKTVFVDIAIFTTHLCDLAKRYLKKGDYCIYECELTYSDKDGKRYYSAVVKNIIFTQNNKKKEG
jgi:single-stranded DNA-binding protein